MTNFSQHNSMLRAPGSQVFLVRGVIFQIPRSLLEIHSTLLFEKFVSTGPVELDVPSKAFGHFCDAMMNPLESSLIRPDPDLREVLDILSIAHKYDAKILEAQALPIAISMTSPENIRVHINSRLSALEIVEIGTSVNCDEVADSAFNLIMKEVRRKQIPTHTALSFAERINEPRFIGRMYYETMLHGSSEWETDPHLTDRQRRNLSRGSVKCMEGWDQISHSWKSGLPEHKCRHGRRCGIEYLSRLTTHYANRGLGSSDVLGRLEAIAGFDLEADQRPSREVRSAVTVEIPHPSDAIREAYYDVPSESTRSPVSPMPRVTPVETRGLDHPSAGCSQVFKKNAHERLAETRRKLYGYFIGIPAQPESPPVETPPKPEPAPVRFSRYVMSFVCP